MGNTQSILACIQEEQKKSADTTFDRKMLERDRGFLIYVSQTYKHMRPYLQGFHLTIDSWQPGRDNEGWRVSNSFLQEMEAMDKYTVVEDVVDKAPTRVKCVPRLTRYLAALVMLTSNKTPPLFTVRSNHLLYVFYVVGDASGKGFGSTIETKDGIFSVLDNGVLRYRN